MSRITDALAAWENSPTNSAALLEAGTRLYDILREFAEPETYTATGLPRRATARARALGAKITHVFHGDTVVARFPNGSEVTALTRLGAMGLGGQTPGRIIQRRPGAAPGAKAPAGDTLEDVLNAFIAGA